MSYGGSHRPDYAGGRIVNYGHTADRRQRQAAEKLLTAITNIDSNVIELANSLVNTASPAVRARLMHFVVGIIFAESDAYVCEGDDSEGPALGYALVQELNNLGIIPKP